MPALIPRLPYALIAAATGVALAGLLLAGPTALPEFLSIGADAGLASQAAAAPPDAGALAASVPTAAADPLGPPEPLPPPFGPAAPKAPAPTVLAPADTATIERVALLEADLHGARSQLDAIAITIRRLELRQIAIDRQLPGIVPTDSMLLGQRTPQRQLPMTAATSPTPPPAAPPAPPAKLPTKAISGWRVVSAAPDEAWIQAAAGGNPIQARLGAPLASFGRVLEIRPEANGWTVVTETGRIN